MEDFFFNIAPEISILSKYGKYLGDPGQRDLDRLLKANSKGLQKSIDQIPDKLKPIYESGVQVVCGKIENGFRDLDNHLNSVGSRIDRLSFQMNELATVMSREFTELIMLQQVTNSLLSDIQDLLKIPDIQKERHYHIEEGLKYLKTALLEENINSDFFLDSLESFSKAIEIEPKDYFSHFHIGFILMFSGNASNPEQAITHFGQSARYALAEENARTTTYNALTKSHLSQKKSSLHSMAAEAYFYSAEASKKLQKTNEAILYFDKCLSIIPDFNLVKYEKAKCLFITGDKTKSIDLLEQIIREDRYFAVRIINDKMLALDLDVIRLLKKLYLEEIDRLSQNENSINCHISGNYKSQVKPRLDQWLHSYEDDYLGLRKVNDTLEGSHPWKNYSVTVQRKHHDPDKPNKWNWEQIISESNIYRTALEFAKIEKEYYEILLPKSIEELKLNEQKRKQEKRGSLIIGIIFWAVLILLFRLCNPS